MISWDFINNQHSLWRDQIHTVIMTPKGAFILTDPKRHGSFYIGYRLVEDVEGNYIPVWGRIDQDTYEALMLYAGDGDSGMMIKPDYDLEDIELAETIIQDASNDRR